MGDHRRTLLATQLRHIDYLEDEIAHLDEEVKKRMLPFEVELELLDTIPGVGRRTAEQVLAEIGIDMNQFPSAAHLCSWAGLAHQTMLSNHVFFMIASNFDGVESSAQVSSDQ